MRLTGPVPIQDEEFATLKENALPNASGTIVVVLAILWLALKSPKIILAVFISISVGLVITLALGLWLVGALNPISIAFAVLFLGIGVDFGIQFSLRYREERYETGISRSRWAHRAGIGLPLTIAAAAAAAGFLSSCRPTIAVSRARPDRRLWHDHRLSCPSSRSFPHCCGCSTRPAKRGTFGFRALAPIDRFSQRHRGAIIAGTLVVVIGGLPLLYFLRFDFNPMNLRSPKAESIATYLDLRRDPATGASAIDILAPSLAVARDTAERVSRVPEVLRAMTLDSFIPGDQEPKLAAIQKAAKVLDPTLAQAAHPPPSDEDDVTALRSAQMR